MIFNYWFLRLPWEYSGVRRVYSFTTKSTKDTKVSEINYLKLRDLRVLRGRYSSTVNPEAAIL